MREAPSRRQQDAPTCALCILIAGNARAVRLAHPVRLAHTVRLAHPAFNCEHAPTRIGHCSARATEHDVHMKDSNRTLSSVWKPARHCSLAGA